MYNKKMRVCKKMWKKKRRRLEDKQGKNVKTRIKQRETVMKNANKKMKNKINNNVQ